MSDYSEYFLNSRADVVQLELMEVTHPNFTETFRIVRNARDGITVDISPSELAVPFQYYPAQIEPSGARNDLDSGIKVSFGDVGEVLAPQIDAVAAAGGFQTKPALRYWTYRSDVLSAPIFGPLTLEIPTLAFDEDGATFEAKAPAANSTKTGERYTLIRFPMQRGFL